MQKSEFSSAFILLNSDLPFLRSNGYNGEAYFEQVFNLFKASFVYS